MSKAAHALHPDTPAPAMLQLGRDKVVLDLADGALAKTGMINQCYILPILVLPIKCYVYWPKCSYVTSPCDVAACNSCSVQSVRLDF